MVKEEIFYDEKVGYTLEDEVDGVKSIKKVPMKFKPEDKTAKYRKEILKKEILSNSKK